METLFQSYCPGNSWLHKAPLSIKYLLLLAPVVVALASFNLWFCLVAWAFTAIILLSARLPWRRALSLPWIFLWMLVFFNIFHLWAGRYELAATLAVTWIIAVYSSRILTLTTPIPVLIDGIQKVLWPLRKIGINVNAISLTVSLIIRSVPYLFSSFKMVRDAARARGMERSLWAQVLPVVIGAVAYAQRTAEAIVARDLLADDENLDD